MLIFLLSANSFAQSKQGTLSGTIKVKKVVTKLPENYECNCDANKKPSFHGGEKALLKYLDTTVTNVYCQFVKDSRTKYLTVIAGFTIDEEGQIKNLKVIKGVSEFCGDIAFDAVRKMPRWNPAMKAGKAVSCVCVLPIKFTIDKFK